MIKSNAPQSNQKLQGHSIKQKIPNFRLGQVLLGTVQRHVSSGLIQTKIKNSTILASTSFPVSVGEQLLLYVKDLKPKPHLKVLESLSKKSGGGKPAVPRSDLSSLLKTDIPISYKSLQSIGSDSTFDVSAFIKIINSNHEFWKRLFWHISTMSYGDVSIVSNWLKEGRSLFLQNVHDLPLQELKEQISFNNRLNSKDIFDWFYKTINVVLKNNDVPGILGSHLANWNQVQKLRWEYGLWSGMFGPLFFKGQSGIMSMSFWRPDTPETQLPRRLSMLVALRNGWVMQFLIEYRQTDLAGAIDVNKPECEKMANDVLSSLVAGLQNKGFNHIGIRVNTVNDLVLDYTQLIPPVQRNEKYIG